MIPECVLDPRLEEVSRSLCRPGADLPRRSVEGLGTIHRMKVELAHEFHYFCPAPLTEEEIAELRWLTAATFRVTGCFDVARVDFRFDANDNNKPYILEINPLPGLNPGYSDLCIEATADGWSYEQLVNRILDEAIERQGVKG